MFEWFPWQGVIVVAALAWPGLASAQQQDAQRAAARELGYSGVESYQAGDYATASSKLEKAYAVLKVPSLGLWSARALIKTNHWVEAAERLRQVQGLEPKGGDAPVQEQAIRDAKAELDALTPRLPRLVITVFDTQPGDAQVTVDGEPIAAALIGEEVTANPGKHELVARSGERSVTKQVLLLEGTKLNVELRFQEGSMPPQGPASNQAEPVPPAQTAATSAEPGTPPKAPGASRKVTGWVLIGLGAAGAAVGATTGVLASGLRTDLEKSPDCKGTECATRQTDAVDSYNSLRTMSSIGLIAGAAALTAGVVLVVTAPKANAQAGRNAPSLWLRVSSQGGELGGTF